MDSSHELQVSGMGGHGVGGYDPTAFAQLVCYGEFIEMMVVFWVETEGHKRQTLTASLAWNVSVNNVWYLLEELPHDDES